MTAPGTLTIIEAAARIGVNTKTIRRRIADGSLVGYRFGPRLIRVDPIHAAHVCLRGALEQDRGEEHDTAEADDEREGDERRRAVREGAHRVRKFMARATA